MTLSLQWLELQHLVNTLPVWLLWTLVTGLEGGVKRWSFLLLVSDVRLGSMSIYICYCDDGLTGPPSQPTNITFSALTINEPFHLVWSIPSDTFNCVCFYFVNTTSAEGLQTTNDTNVLITKPTDKPANTTYNVSVAAVDIFNRTGPWSDPLCFLFQGLPMNFTLPFCSVSHPLHISS